MIYNVTTRDSVTNMYKKYGKKISDDIEAYLLNIEVTDEILRLFWDNSFALYIPEIMTTKDDNKPFSVLIATDSEEHKARSKGLEMFMDDNGQIYLGEAHRNQINSLQFVVKEWDTEKFRNVFPETAEILEI